MDKKLRILGICAALAVSATVFLLPSETPPPLPDPTLTVDTQITTLASKLEKPRSMAVTSDGTIFVAEKSGRVRVIERGLLLEKPLITFSAADSYDGGLLGMAVSPDSASEVALYVFYTYEDGGDLWNKISKITVKEGKLSKVETILDRIPGSRFINGGILKFGPDGMLYAGTGSVSDSAEFAQNPDSLAGKILRISPSGEIPYDNPDANSYVYALGMRNPRGLAWDSAGAMYATDAGPTKNDEINLIRPGENYGWPEQQCSEGEMYADPLACYDPALGIAGIAVSEKNGRTGILIASLRATNLYLVDISNPEENPKALIGGLGRIRDVAHDSDGNLYVLTSNTDGMGFPGSSDDLLVRIEG